MEKKEKSWYANTANATIGQVTNYAVYKVNTQNPTGFDETLRYDGVGQGHYDSVTKQYLIPHVHDKTTQGGLRAPSLDEIPK